MNGTDPTRSDTPSAPRGLEEQIRKFDSMTAEELAEEFEKIWSGMDEDNYDGELLRACLDALDKKSPMPEMPGVNEAYARFTDVRRSIAPEGDGVPRTEEVRPRRVAVRIAIAAAIAVAAILGTLVTAQAAGVDVFGAVVRWTRETFSFGPGYTEPASNAPRDVENGENLSAGLVAPNDALRLRHVLDEYGITGVHVPEWLPEGASLESVSVSDKDSYGLFCINAVYTSGGKTAVMIEIFQSVAEAANQIQIDPAYAGSAEVNGTKLYFLNNENNYTAAWHDDKYEYYVVGTDREDVNRVAESMIQ